MPNPSPPSAPSGFLPPLGDPLIDDRLARLAARRSPVADAAAASKSTSDRVTPKRRHAAKGSRSAALAMSVTTTLGLAAYLQRADAVASTDTAASSPVAPSPTAAAIIATAAQPVATLPATIAPVATLAPVIATAPVASAAATTVPPAPTATGTGLVDGAYAGDTFTNKWGTVQVQVTISNGAITDVTTLQTPTKDRKSVRINDRAVPQLNSETIAAQSAQIDIVSGATYTSKGYRQSIQSALDAAQSPVAA